MINAYALNDERISSHNFSGFDCGDEGLNSYIRDFQNSLVFHNANFNNTTVIMDDEEDCEIAFITTRFNALIIGEKEIIDLAAELSIQTNLPNEIPAIEILYLAVNNNQQERGYGKSILGSIIAKALKMSNEIGCRYIFLWSIRNQGIIDFYKKYGFKEMRESSEGENLMLMRLDLLPYLSLLDELEE